MNQEEMVEIGIIFKVRGAKGELTFSPLADDINRFFLLKEVFLRPKSSLPQFAHA